MPASNDQADVERAQAWPSLAFDDWKDTCATLQLWTQVVGKVRLELAPMVNHWWQVTLYVTATGLTTSAMPGTVLSWRSITQFCSVRSSMALR